MLSEEMAKLRTQLANERTFLAYVRTSLAMVAGGASLIAFFQSAVAQGAGWFLLIAGLLTLVIGGLRYRATNQLLPRGK